MKNRTGWITKKSGRLYVHVSYTDQVTGKRRELVRRAQDREHAKELRKELTAEIDDPQREQKLAGSRMTFSDLAQQYQETKLIPPQYQNDRKIVGLRSWNKLRSFLKPVIAYFGSKLIRDIRVGDLEAYKLARLRTPKGKKKQSTRSITCINRELGLMRAAFSYAKRNDWIKSSPFDQCERLISAADEVKRTRVITTDEETRLLAACTGKIAHLRAVVIAALDTGARRNEILTLRKSDIDLFNREIKLRALNTKTAKDRSLPISERLFLALESILSDLSDDSLIFPYIDIPRAFPAACKRAGVVDLHFHDLRHSFGTKLADADVPIKDIALLLGHSDLKTTLRYLNKTANTLNRAKAVWDALNEKAFEISGEGESNYVN